MSYAIPPEVLLQHVAILGKTGAGKSSTAKLAIEQVVADGARVCVLDPIKSDWWGLTSSADGKRGGLPFHILGGPHGHVPLHSAAGRAIADVVATGALPLSIIDMADFEPGGQAKFFVDFAPTLLRKMRGVVYLVIEEAHLFAPKERSGVGAENMSIHWAKTIATAGRSKGVRLVLLTQRTQALHNALLGSCDTLIAHRLTAPADQDPVVKWLKANTSKEILEQVSGSLASLKTGEGWICSGEAKLFERRHFPRIHTYDNTATPTGEGETREIKTAPVDPEKLRAIIGDAVEQAKQDDPRELRRKIADLTRELTTVKKSADYSKTIPPGEKVKEKLVLTDADRELLARLADGLLNIREFLELGHAHLYDEAHEKMMRTLEAFRQDSHDDIAKMRAEFERRIDGKTFQKIIGKLAAVPATTTYPKGHGTGQAVPPIRRASEMKHEVKRAGGPPSSLPPGEHATLTAALQYPGLDRKRLSVLTGYRRSSRDAYIARLGSKGLLEVHGNALHATEAGLAALNGSFQPLPTGAALISYWRDRLPEGERKTLDVLIAANGDDVDRDVIDSETGYKRSSRDAYLTRLKARGLVEFTGRGTVRASEELF